MRESRQELGKALQAGKPYKAVVSVLMLREGWDVPEVGVILLLRKFSSRVYGQQVIGRGLRRAGQQGQGLQCAAAPYPRQVPQRQILGMSARPDLEYVWKMLPQIKERVRAIPGLIGGIVRYGD